MFATQKIEASAAGYRASATLEVRGTPHPVSFDFQLSQTAAGATLLTGTSKLDRLALGLGIMEFADTQWVGQDVEVDVRLVQTLGATPNR